MKRLYLILLWMCLLSGSLLAQNRLSIFLGSANKYAEVELSDYRRRLCREYKVSDRQLARYYRLCGRNWGNVGIALEIAHTSGRRMDDVCDYYSRYHRHGWERILIEVGIRPDSRHYHSFYDRIHSHGGYWDDCYRSYCDRHGRHHPHVHKHHKHRHPKYHKHNRPHKRYYDDDDDDDDDDD